MITDMVFTILGAGLGIYTIGWLIAWWTERPAVVRHPYTGQWTAARSLRVEPPPTMEQTVSRIRINSRQHRQYE